MKTAHGGTRASGQGGAEVWLSLETSRGGGCSIIHTFEVSWLQEAALGAQVEAASQSYLVQLELVGS